MFRYPVDPKFQQNHYLTRLRRYKPFCAFLVKKIVNAQLIINKTTATVCISRQVLKGKKYGVQDIHNFFIFC